MELKIEVNIGLSDRHKAKLIVTCLHICQMCKRRKSTNTFAEKINKQICGCLQIFAATECPHNL